MRALVFAALAVVCVVVPATSATTAAEQAPSLTFKVVNMKGQRRVLSRHTIDPYVYSLSPDQNRFAYVSQRAEGEMDAPLIIADVRSPSERVLIDTGWAFRGVSWAPDGRQIASIGQTTQDDAGVWLVNPEDGTINRKIRSENGVGLVWSPNSRFLANGGPVSVFSLKTGEERVLSPGHSPAWSPDGTRMAFVHNTVFNGQVLGVASVQTGAVRDYTRANSAFPAWSPDGKRIAFIRFVRDAYHLDLWVTPSGKKSPHRLAVGVARFAPFLWSPKGKRIAFVSGTTLFVRRLNGQGRSVAHEGADITPLAWSRDGRRILYFTSRR